jgi:16S rRNA G966 N2-methylase RsmD
VNPTSYARSAVNRVLQAIERRCYLERLNELRKFNGSLSGLLAELRGGSNPGVDVIYFDPPYNTGSDAFSYNDNRCKPTALGVDM